LPSVSSFAPATEGGDSGTEGGDSGTVGGGSGTEGGDSGSNGLISSLFNKVANCLKIRTTRSTALQTQG
jgi:hypothetical protein